MFHKRKRELKVCVFRRLPMCVLDGVSFFLLKHNKVWLMAYLKDFDETERAKPSSARHQAKSRVMQQNFIVVSTEEEKRKKHKY